MRKIYTWSFNLDNGIYVDSSPEINSSDSTGVVESATILSKDGRMIYGLVIARSYNRALSYVKNYLHDLILNNKTI